MTMDTMVVGGKVIADVCDHQIAVRHRRIYVETLDPQLPQSICCRLLRLLLLRCNQFCAINARERPSSPQTVVTRSTSTYRTELSVCQLMTSFSSNVAVSMELSDFSRVCRMDEPRHWRRIRLYSMRTYVRNIGRQTQPYTSHLYANVNNPPQHSRNSTHSVANISAGSRSNAEQCVNVSS